MAKTTTTLGDLEVWHRARTGPITLEIATDLAEQVCLVIIERDAMLARHERDVGALCGVLAPAVDLVRQACSARVRRARIGVRVTHQTREDAALVALLNAAAYLAYSCGDHAAASAYANEALERDLTVEGPRLSLLVVALLAITCPYSDLSTADHLTINEALAAHRQPKG